MVIGSLNFLAEASVKKTRYLLTMGHEAHCFVQESAAVTLSSSPQCSSWDCMDCKILDRIFQVYISKRGTLYTKLKTVRLVNKHWKEVSRKWTVAIRPAPGTSKDKVAWLLDTMPSIRRLDLRDQQLFNEEAEGLAQILEGSTRVCELDLQGCVIVQSTGTGLAQIVQSCSNLSVLKAKHCDLGDNGYGLFCKALASHKSISYLEVQCSKESSILLAAALKDTESPIQGLSFPHSEISSSADMSSALASCQHLEEVDLFLTHMELDVWVSVLKGLSLCPRLRVLQCESLSTNREGIEPVIDAICSMPTVTNLILRRCGLQSDAIELFAVKVNTAPSVCCVDLTGTSLSEVGFDFLLGAWQENNRLKEIRLSGCRGEMAPRTWAAGFCPQLRVLDLSGNRGVLCSNLLIDQFINFLRASRSLIELNIDVWRSNGGDCIVDDGRMKDLMAALLSCQSLKRLVLLVGGTLNIDWFANYLSSNRSLETFELFVDSMTPGNLLEPLLQESNVMKTLGIEFPVGLIGYITAGLSRSSVLTKLVIPHAEITKDFFSMLLLPSCRLESVRIEVPPDLLDECCRVSKLNTSLEEFWVKVKPLSSWRDLLSEETLNTDLSLST